MKTGIILGLVVEVWTFVVIVLGWHKDPSLVNLFYLVIIYQAVITWWGLKQTAAAGKAYGGQIGAGVLMSAYGAIIIVIGSYLMTSVVFPSFFAEVEAAGRATLTAQGLTPEQVQAQLDLIRPMQNSVANSLTGGIATIITGFVLSLIIGAFVKAQPSQTPPQAG
jgi:hypothetical protein